MIKITNNYPHTVMCRNNPFVGPYGDTEVDSLELKMKRRTRNMSAELNCKYKPLTSASF